MKRSVKVLCPECGSDKVRVKLGTVTGLKRIVSTQTFRCSKCDYVKTEDR